MANVAATRQNDRQVDLVIAEQATKGTLPSATSGIRFPFSTHGGFQYNEQRNPDPRNRKNGMTGASYGGKKLYTLPGVQGPMIIKGYDQFWQAAQRNTYTAEASIDQTDISQIQSVSTGGLVTFTASPITAGVRVGQIHEYDSGVAAADRNIPLMVTAVTSTTIQYHKAMTAVGSATDFGFDILRNVTNGTQRWPFAIEDRDETKDVTEMGDFCILNQVQLAAQGTGLVQLTFDFLVCSLTERTGSDSPYFTSVTATTGELITAPNVELIVNGTVTPFETFNMTWNLNSYGDETNSEEYIDVDHGVTAITGNYTILNDATASSAFTSYKADSYQSLGLVMTDPDDQFFGIALPYLKFLNPSKSPRGNDRFSNRSFQFEAAEDDRGSGYANTMAIVSTTT